MIEAALDAQRTHYIIQYPFKVTVQLTVVLRIYTVTISKLKYAKRAK
jgi:hypothetical protein